MRKISLLCLAALSAAAHPSRASADPARSSLEAAASDYAQAVENFQRYAAEKTAGIKNEGNMPFLLTHGHRTPRSILLVHGFTDSPYSMRALADIYYAAGYNVVAILLPGHGTKPEDLIHAKLPQWEKETQLGFNLSGGLGDEVSLAGFSTGGALVLEALAQNDASYSPRRIGDVFLFSPALEIAGDDIKKIKLELVCKNPDVVSQFKPWVENDAAPEVLPYRYVKWAINGACQVYDLTRDNRRRRAAILSAIGKGVGVFAVESEADQIVDPQAVETFMASLPPGTKQSFILYPKSAGVGHNDVPRPEANPSLYAAMVAQIRTFIAIPSAGPTLNALSASFDVRR